MDPSFVERPFLCSSHNDRPSYVAGSVGADEVSQSGMPHSMRLSPREMFGNCNDQFDNQFVVAGHL